MSDEEDASVEAQLVPEEDTEQVRKLKAIHCIAWFDAIQACFLLAYYGQMYAAYGWCPSNMICIKDSFWDLDIIEGATWFGIFVVYAIQLIAAINLCHVTKRPGIECLRERCQSWYEASKILSKVLVIECFILFVPHSKPYIFNWWVFLVKAIFRAIAITSVFHFMVDLRQQEALAIRNSHSTTFIPILTPTRTFPGQHTPAVPSSTSIYIGAGLEFSETLANTSGEYRFPNCNSPTPDDDPPPPYSEAIKNCKEETTLLMHV
ncbi:unnamed protein product [Allacma fusca]|uniref:Uncharacterized protein n=1 Tax=Allacma fusca TaxID=39272 RepID=A0A8J2JN05_9HEXA|nr:unnamed protein product [Allacma fusca]